MLKDAKTKITLNKSSDSIVNSSTLGVEAHWLYEDDLFEDDFKIQIERKFSLRNLTDDEETKLNEKSLCEDHLLIAHQEAFNRNLLKNCFGTEHDSHHKCSSNCGVQSCVGFKDWIKTNCPKFRYWNIVDSEGCGWKVTPSFKMSGPVPEELHFTVGSSCFATSSSRCTKTQLVSLNDEGLVPELMDHVRPPLEVSESCAANTRNGSIYELKVSLLDKSHTPIREYSEVRHLQPCERQWQRVYFRIQDYPPGIRFVMFSHSGLNTKMAGGSIIAKLPCFICRQNKLSTVIKSACTRKENNGYLNNCDTGTKYNEFA